MLKRGRPTAKIPRKNQRTIVLTDAESTLLTELSDFFGLTKTATVVEGLALLDEKRRRLTDPIHINQPDKAQVTQEDDERDTTGETPENPRIIM